MEQNARSYTNGEITVYWKPSACIHSSICYSKLLEVFNPRKRPWVNLAAAESGKIIEIINQCPTEALTWKYNDESLNEKVTQKDCNHIRFRRPDYRPGEEAPLSPEPVKIRLMQNGPILAEGSFELITLSGSKIQAAKIVSFCRCGHSKTMPFCDGTHRLIKFNDQA